MRKKIAFIVFPFLLIALSLLYSFSSHRNKSKKVEKIEVEFEGGENGFLTHQMVNKLLIQNQSEVENQPKSIIDLHTLETNVLANPYVENASVFLTINGALKTVIKQREPIARIKNSTSSYYIDKYGVKVPLSENYSARVFLVEGVETEKEISQITELVNIILADDFLKKEIVGIQKTTTNEYVFNVRSGNYKVAFGEFTEVAVKFNKLKVFYNKAFADKTIENYKIINVKYHNQVVCTK